MLRTYIRAYTRALGAVVLLVTACGDGTPSADTPTGPRTDAAANADRAHRVIHPWDDSGAWCYRQARKLDAHDLKTALNHGEIVEVRSTTEPDTIAGATYEWTETTFAELAWGTRGYGDGAWIKRREYRVEGRDGPVVAVRWSPGVSHSLIGWSEIEGVKAGRVDSFGTTLCGSNWPFWPHDDDGGGDGGE